MNNTHKGKTAKEWFKLHEVMRRDFGRLLREKQRDHDTTRKPCWCNPKTITVYGASKGEGSGEWVVGNGEEIVATTGSRKFANKIADALNQ